MASAETVNVVLVHGGFVDASGWEGVYSTLKRDGYRVSVVQNPTSSLAEDVAATRRFLAALDGPAILVGHSYGGVVITEAGADPKVEGLVYIAAFAPDKGESVADQGSAAGCARPPDPPAPAGVPAPGQGEIRQLFRRRRGSRQGRLHGRLEGPVGRGCAERHDHRASVEEEAQLVPRGHGRQDDPARRPAAERADRSPTSP